MLSSTSSEFSSLGPSQILREACNGNLADRQACQSSHPTVSLKGPHQHGEALAARVPESLEDRRNIKDQVKASRRSARPGMSVMRLEINDRPFTLKRPRGLLSALPGCQPGSGSFLKMCKANFPQGSDSKLTHSSYSLDKSSTMEPELQPIYIRSNRPTPMPPRSKARRGSNPQPPGPSPRPNTPRPVFPGPAPVPAPIP